MASSPNQPFSRLPVPSEARHLSQLFNDIYDKLNAVAAFKQTVAGAVPATPATPTSTAIPALPVTPSGGGGGGASGSSTSLTDVPVLAALPSNNPTQGAPYAQDGVLVIVNKILWRYYGAPTYQWQQPIDAVVLLTDTHANRVASFPAANYIDALFYESDTTLFLFSNGTEWLTLSGTIRDTHANRLANWPSVQFGPETPFYETDRTVTYLASDASGTVTVAGGVNVTWTAGDHFINTGTGFNAAQWPAGTPITIGGVQSTVSSVTNSTTLTLQTAVTNGAGQAYSVASGRWVYATGQYSSALANLPTDLGENDTTLVSSKVVSGFLFFENDTYFHQLQWNVSAWQRGPEDTEHSDSFHEMGSAPSDGGWHAMDGSTVTYLKYDGTTGSRVLPNSDATATFTRGGNSYSATITAAVAPTVGGQTDDTTIGFTPASASSATAQAGAGQTVLDALTSGGSLGTDPHHHTLSAATISLAGGPPVSHFEVVRIYRR